MGDQAVDRQADTQPIWSGSQGELLGNLTECMLILTINKYRNSKSACWTPDGANLFYSLRGEDELRMIYFNKASSGIGKARAAAQPWLCLYFKYAPRQSLKATSYSADCKSISIKNFPVVEETLTSGEKQKVNGAIRNICIDQVTGERMVISFEDSNVLALFLVRKMTGLAVATDSVCLFR
jgi:hypothetical protein